MIELRQRRASRCRLEIQLDILRDGQPAGQVLAVIGRRRLRWEVLTVAMPKWRDVIRLTDSERTRHEALRRRRAHLASIPALLED